MKGNAGQVIFFVLAAASVAGACLVVFLSNPIHSAVAMIACLVSLAMLFWQLSAHFLGIIQIMIYAGAIVVLFIFVIQVLDQRAEPAPRRPRWPMGLAALLCLAPVGAVLSAVFQAMPARGRGLPSNFGTIEAVGRFLFTEYVFAFEITAVLLLAAIVGAVAMARRKG